MIKKQHQRQQRHWQVNGGKMNVITDFFSGCGRLIEVETVGRSSRNHRLEDGADGRRNNRRAGSPLIRCHHVQRAQWTCQRITSINQRSLYRFDLGPSRSVAEFNRRSQRYDSDHVATRNAKLIGVNKVGKVSTDELLIL